MAISPIKYAIITGGIAAGAGLAWFYGPALAYYVAYNASITMATMAATPTWYTYNFLVKPAAIDAGIYFATSPLVHTGIGAGASILGYGFGKIGCATYEGVKYTVGTGIPAAAKLTAETTYSAASTIGTTTYNAGAYLAPKISSAANTVGSTAVSVTGSALSSITNATSSLLNSSWNWWSSAKSTVPLSTSVLTV